MKDRTNMGETIKEHNAGVTIISPGPLYPTAKYNFITDLGTSFSWPVRLSCIWECLLHVDTIKWKHFRPYWAFVRGIHGWPVDSPQKRLWSGVFMCAWTNGWAHSRDAGDLRCPGAACDVNVRSKWTFRCPPNNTRSVMTTLFILMVLLCFRTDEIIQRLIGKTYYSATAVLFPCC